jgi:hypothetical protein
MAEHRERQHQRHSATPDEEPHMTETPPPEQAAPVPPGEDLRLYPNAQEEYANFLARSRGVVVISQNPTDIVPNTPQITMGERVPVADQEGLAYASPPAGQGLPAGGEPESVAVVLPSEEHPMPVAEAIAAAEQVEAQESAAEEA